MNRAPFRSGHRKLKVGRTITVGSNRFTLRPRPVTPSWEIPETPRASNASRMMLAMRFTLPLFFLFALMRFFSSLWALPILLLIVITGLLAWGFFRRKRRAQLDCASLVLATASAVRVDRNTNLASKRPLDAEYVQILLAPGLTPKAKTTVSLSAAGSCATVGPYAFEYALWVAGQVRAQGIRARVARLDTEPEETTGFEGASVFWSLSSEPGDVPVATVLPSRPTGAGLWCAEMQALLAESGEAELPDSCALSDLLDESRTATRSRWAQGSTAPSAWDMPVGVSSAGPVVVNLVEDGPHALVVGGTGSGKSELLTTLVLALAMRNSPKALKFVFIDYKGGAGLEHLASLPHVEHSLTDLDGTQTPWLLRALRALLTSRKVQSRRHGFRSLEDWAKRHADNEELPPPPARVVIVADEVRTLADQHPNLLEELVSVCRQGRSLGVHLVAATQRPGGAISSEMRSVIDLRVALRCAEVADSVDAIGSPVAAHLPRIPGRAIVDGQQVQLAHVHNPDSVVATIVSCQGSPATTLTLEVPAPLPHRVTHEELGTAPAGTLGLFENPSTCATDYLLWNGSPLLIAGPALSAKTLLAAAASASLRAKSGFPPPPDDQVKSQHLLHRPIQENGCVLWAGLLPHDPGSQRICSLGNNPNLGDLAYLLTRIPKYVSAQRTTTLVIPELSEVLSAIGLAAGPEAPGQIMRELLDAGRQGWLTLIATDTNHRFDARQFDNLLVHIPSLRATQYPEIARLLPHRGESPLGSLEHWVSADSGRFAAIGFGQDPSPALIPLGNRGDGEQPGQSRTTFQDSGVLRSSGGVKPVWPQPLAKLPLRSPSDIQAIFEGQAAAFRADQRAGGLLHPLSVQIIADPHIDLQILEDDLHAHAADTNPLNVERLSLSQWHQIDPDPRVFKLAVQPNREVVRVLVAHVPDAWIWLNASLPFATTTGVLVTQGTATPLKLGSRYADVTVRT